MAINKNKYHNKKQAPFDTQYYNKLPYPAEKAIPAPSNTALSTYSRDDKNWVSRPLFINRIKFDGRLRGAPEKEGDDQLEQWIKAMKIVTRSDWLATKSSLARWVGDPENLKNTLSIIETLTKRPLFVSRNPVVTKGTLLDWFNFQPVMKLTPHMIQNIIDQKINMRDLIAEYAIGSIFLLVKMTFTDTNTEKIKISVMVLKFDREKNTCYWEDNLGGQHDVT